MKRPSDAEEASRLRFLRGAFLVFSGDAGGMEILETFDDSNTLGKAARKLYLFFLDLLFDGQKADDSESLNDGDGVPPAGEKKSGGQNER